MIVLYSKVMRGTSVVYHRLIKIFPLFSMLLCMSLAMGATLTEEERQWLQEHGPVTFVSQTLYPPFEFINTQGERSGMCIELARWMATELGFKARFKDMPFQEAQKAILEGRADVLTSLFYSLDRDEHFDFTLSTWEVPALIFVPVDRYDITGLDGLRNKRLAIQEGDYAADFLKKKGIPFTHVKVPNFSEAIHAIVEGKADAVIGDKQIVLYHLFLDQLTDRVKSVGEPLYLGQNSMAVRENQSILISILNKGLKNARERGVMDRITRTWLGSQYSQSPGWLEQYRYPVFLGAALLLVAAVMVFMWNHQLRRAIRHRTRALEESESRFQALFDQAMDGMMLAHGKTLKLKLPNPQMCRMLGYKAEELEQMTMMDIHPPEKMEAIQKDFEDQIQGNLHLIPEIPFVRKDGSPFLADVSAVPVTMDGEPYLFGVFRDVTERREAESQLLRLAAAISQAAETIVITDPEGCIVYVNPAFEKSSGYSGKEADGKKSHFVHAPQYSPAFYQDMKAQLDRENSWEGRIVSQRKDGECYTEEVSISTVRNDQGEIINYVEVKRDITRELEMEHQLRQSQKMEAIGKLTGGVAHDFNNLLQGINGYTDIARLELPEDSPVQATLEEIAKAGDRAASLVSQLLAFSRRQILQPQKLNLNEVVTQLLRMLRRLIGEDIRLHFVPFLNLPPLAGDKGMIEQILLNLCVNARDAMPEGGTLTIKTDQVLFDPAFCRDHPWAQPGQYVLLQVTDTGCGMERAVQEHIFEPFFTTKEPGKGTGLGLSTVYGIVRQHEGFLQVESEPAQGSCFSLYLPVCETGHREKALNKIEEARGGTETVLLAEDNETVRSLAQKLLADGGYRVLAVPNGREAVQTYRHHRDEIDLLLFDVVMPNLGGREAYEQIREMDPGVAVLFASGYSEEVIQSNFLQDQDLELLKKPFSREDLLRTVRKVLDEAKQEKR